jgi:beta-galactosidase
VINGIHRVIVRSTMQGGTIAVTAEAEGLKAAALEIVAHPVTMIEQGLTLAMPAVQPVVLSDKPRYGPDLPPAQKKTDRSSTWSKVEMDIAGTKLNGELIKGLTVAFPRGAKIQATAANGARIYTDQELVFTKLPAQLAGSEYIQVPNTDAGIMAAEGYVFTLAKPGRVFVAYDDANANAPTVAGIIKFRKTGDRLEINGRTHAVYESDLMKAGEEMYLGTNNWPEQPRQGVNAPVIFALPSSP